MKTIFPIVLFKGYPDDGLVPPLFCRDHQLLNRFSVRWEEVEESTESKLKLVKRILKLFPFEWTQIVREEGRVRDVFDDWDSYLEWVAAENRGTQALFASIRVMRKKQILGYLIWEGPRPFTELAIYTHADQSVPLLEACRSLIKQPETGTQDPWTLLEGRADSQNPSRFQKLQEWALSFFSSSVRRGTISKRSPTKP